MQAENIKEYELIRAEMLNVKDCITKYLGYVFGGTGAAIYGLARLNENFAVDTVRMGVIALALSALFTLILLILVYKFYSHNRFAGYCKLLNHERFAGYCKLLNHKRYKSSVATDRSFFLWEISVDRLRRLDTGRLDPQTLLAVMQTGGIRVELLRGLLAPHIGPKPPIDSMKSAKGLWLLLQSFFGKMPSSSWGFPPYVVTIFFVIVAGFLIAGLIFTPFSDSPWLKLFGYLVILFQAFAWWRIGGKFHALMEGSATIDAFFIKLLPVRAAFLIKNKITPEYIYILGDE
jgi:hypothetical protein